MSSQTPAPNLGTLSILPFELRTKIFSLVLYLFADLRHPPQGDRSPHLSTILTSKRTTLLQVSKDIYREAIKILVNVNGFEICIERELNPDTDEEAQVSVREGPWTYNLRAQAGPLRKFSTPPLSLMAFTQQQHDAFVRCGLFKELRSVWLRIEDLQESDIVPGEDGPDVGTEPQEFMEVLSGIVQSLKGCVLKELDVRVNEIAEVCWSTDDSKIQAWLYSLIPYRRNRLESRFLSLIHAIIQGALPYKFSE